MITNIIKSTIKDFPQIANKEVELVYTNNYETAISTEDNDVVVVVNTPLDFTINTTNDWKISMIVTAIKIASSEEEESRTFQELSDTIDRIIKQNTVYWKVGN